MLTPAVSRQELALKDSVSVVTLVMVSVALAICGTIALYFIRETRLSRLAADRIHACIHERLGSMQERTRSSAQESVNKVRLDEILQGSQLLRWAKCMSVDTRSTKEYLVRRAPASDVWSLVRWRLAAAVSDALGSVFWCVF